MSDPKTGEEIELRSGAMPEDWLERNDPGYIPGGAGAMAERILAEPPQGHAEALPFYRTEAEANRPRKRTAFDGINNEDRP
jgi:hypothetical protein